MFDFWRKWFVTASALMVVMGLGFAVLGLTPAIGLVTDLYDPAFWGEAAPDAGARAFQTFAFGVMGAMLAGWGLMALGLGLHAMARRERWAWTYACASIAVWFVVDSAMSVASGASINVAGNIGFLLLLGPPLIGLRGHMSNHMDGEGPARATQTLAV